MNEPIGWSLYREFYEPIGYGTGPSGPMSAPILSGASGAVGPSKLDPATESLLLLPIYKSLFKSFIKDIISTFLAIDDLCDIIVNYNEIGLEDM